MFSFAPSSWAYHRNSTCTLVVDPVLNHIANLGSVNRALSMKICEVDDGGSTWITKKTFVFLCTAIRDEDAVLLFTVET